MSTWNMDWRTGVEVPVYNNPSTGQQYLFSLLDIYFSKFPEKAKETHILLSPTCRDDGPWYFTQPRGKHVLNEMVKTVKKPGWMETSLIIACEHQEPHNSFRILCQGRLYKNSLVIALPKLCDSMKEWWFNKSRQHQTFWLLEVQARNYAINWVLMLL